MAAEGGCGGIEAGMQTNLDSHCPAMLRTDTLHNKANRLRSQATRPSGSAVGWAILLFVLLGFPAVQSLEVGPDDLRLTYTGPLGQPDFSAFSPALAMNSTDDSFLVAWNGNGTLAAFADEREVHVQLFHAGTGLPATSYSVRISNENPLPYTGVRAGGALLAANTNSNTFFIVWSGNGDENGQLLERSAVFGRHLNNVGKPISAPRRLTALDDPGQSSRNYHASQLLYNPIVDEYIVAWGGYRQLPGEAARLVTWFHRISGTTGETVGNFGPFTITHDELESAPRISLAEMTTNPATGNYVMLMVACCAVNDPGSRGQSLIFAQGIDSRTGSLIAPHWAMVNDVVVGSRQYPFVRSASMAFEQDSSRAVVVWQASSSRDPDEGELFSIFARPLDEAGAAVGDISLVSEMPDYSHIEEMTPFRAVVRAGSKDQGFLVAWRARFRRAGLLRKEIEMFARRLTANGNPIGDAKVYTKMGPDGLQGWHTGFLRLEYDPNRNRFLSIWDGNDNRPDLSDQEYEVFGQFLDTDVVHFSGFE